MGLGVGIILLLIGLILVSGAIDLPASINDVVATNTLGWIFILVGVLALVLGLVASRRARSSTVVEERHVR